jgi:four helix bundle protein
MFRFETLEIWQAGISFNDRIYSISDKFPKHELFCLTSQLRRAAISVTANIAEGSASHGVKDFKNFLNYSIRSVAEIVSELFIAKRRGYLNDSDFNHLYSEAEVLIKRITCFKNNLKFY